jgi:hypothetical protein
VAAGLCLKCRPGKRINTQHLTLNYHRQYFCLLRRFFTLDPFLLPLNQYKLFPIVPVGSGWTILTIP